MNVKKAKQHIANTLRAYFAKDKYGQYLIPQNKQRPILLIGAPGIGKTDIVAQTAAELNIGLVALTMSHHTRESLTGQTVIKHRLYENAEFDISEHTTGELIATMYDIARDTGITRGILFIDEINSVLEKNDPVMQQFLQRKTYMGSKLPDGWVVIASGNIPDYNNTAANFDIFTLDKYKCIDVEPNFEVWKEYSYKASMNAAVMIYLGLNPYNFYRIDNTEYGTQFVTARGWEDLSKMINVYETYNMPVDSDLVGQYLHHDGITADFTAYYAKYKNIRSKFRIADILDGSATPEFKASVAGLGLEDKYTFLGILLDMVCKTTREFLRSSRVFNVVTDYLKGLQSNPTQALDLIKKSMAADRDIIKRAKKAHNLLEENEVFYMMKLASMEKYRAEAAQGGYANVKKSYDIDAYKFRTTTMNMRSMFTNLFNFCEDVYGEDSNEMGSLVTELSTNAFTSIYIARFGCDELHKYDKTDIFKQKHDALLQEVANMQNATENQSTETEQPDAQ